MAFLLEKESAASIAGESKILAGGDYSVVFVGVFDGANVQLQVKPSPLEDDDQPWAALGSAKTTNAHDSFTIGRAKIRAQVNGGGGTGSITCEVRRVVDNQRRGI